MVPVATVPPTLPFVDALAAGLLAEVGEDLPALADVLVLLPTRRACRSLREAFVRQTEGRALLLPRIQPIGEVEGYIDLAPVDGVESMRAMFERVREAALGGASRILVGTLGGAVNGRPGTGMAVGAAGGAAAGLLGVLLTRGPDVLLPKGTMLEMVLDRPLQFEPHELDFSSAAPARTVRTVAAPSEEKKSSRPLTSWPF